MGTLALCNLVHYITATLLGEWINNPYLITTILITPFINYPLLITSHVNCPLINNAPHSITSFVRQDYGLYRSDAPFINYPPILITPILISLAPLLIVPVIRLVYILYCSDDGGTQCGEHPVGVSMGNPGKRYDDAVMRGE